MAQAKLRGFATRRRALEDAALGWAAPGPATLRNLDVEHAKGQKAAVEKLRRRLGWGAERPKRMLLRNRAGGFPIRIPILLTLAFLAATASAQHIVCDERSYPELTLCFKGDDLVPDCSGSESDRFIYVDNDPCQTQGCGFSIWIYEESNGYEGLQRKDAVGDEDDFPPWLKDDTCGGLIQPDTVLF